MTGGCTGRTAARTPAAGGSAAAPLPAREPLRAGLPPVAAAGARLLVLGSFPGVASLAAQQYYAHPRNQFWPIVAALWGRELAAWPYAERIAEARQRGLAIWDVHAACRRRGSLDSAIDDARPNDLAGLVAGLPGLQAIAHNGGESARAQRLMSKCGSATLLIPPRGAAGPAGLGVLTRTLGVAVLRLPSTSPANAGWSFERKLAAWRAAFAACALA